MRISKEEQIAGVPALDIRRVFRRMGTDLFLDINHVREVVGANLDIKENELNSLVDQLIEAGYIYLNREYYRLSDKAFRVAAASTGNPIPRAKADALVQELIERAKLVNDSDTWDRIERIEMFGSMLDLSHQTVNDIDLIVTLSDRYRLDASQDGLNALAHYIWLRTGSGGQDVSRLMLFPSEEVFKRLKNRKRAYHLLDHRNHDAMRSLTTCTVVFEDHADPIPLPDSMRYDR